MSKPRLMIGLGEVLWDLLPSGKLLGGAPTNFAYMATVLGNRGLVASRVGDDELGREARHAMDNLGVSTLFLQKDVVHDTGTARVSLDTAGHPDFSIDAPVAWDFLEWTTEWEQLASRADVVCYGSLAQRSAVSADTIEKFLRATPRHTLRICDANVRKPFYSIEVLRKSFRYADIVKLNEQELAYVSPLVGGSHLDDLEIARRLLKEFNLQMICITKGSAGSSLVTASEVESHSGFSVAVADSIGAGDAFTACVAHYFGSGMPLRQMNELANRIAAWVATQVGATPLLTPAKLKELTEETLIDGVTPYCNAP